MNGQDFSVDGVQFEYQPMVHVHSLEPSRGPIAGGTYVNVTGAGFSQRAALLGYLSCRFNMTSVVAVWVSSSEVHCVAPEHDAGLVTVELTQNEQQYTADGTQFEYTHADAHALLPRAGPVRGGTLVEVHGAGIESPSARGVFCQFGGADAVAASYESEELLRCVSPAALGASAGAVSLRVLNNDAVYTTSLVFTYRAVCSVHLLEPVAGAITGGTLVTVYGSAFVDAPGAQCMFGVAAVPARVVRAGVLECIAPVPVGAAPSTSHSFSSSYPTSSYPP